MEPERPSQEAKSENLQSSGLFGDVSGGRCVALGEWVVDMQPLGCLN
jgi:hypothetical protein